MPSIRVDTLRAECLPCSAESGERHEKRPIHPEISKKGSQNMGQWSTMIDRFTLPASLLLCNHKRTGGKKRSVHRATVSRSRRILHGAAPPFRPRGGEGSGGPSEDGRHYLTY
ncbi:MAG: hypothetical protein HQL50_14750 [Magnetococcales bacterium]|nr:hypothetical protein [Magnetococcales bacterium]